MSVSLIRTHMMQISNTDRPGPTVMVEKGKSFPFYNQLQLGGDNSNIQYPHWQLFGGFKPLNEFNTTNCPDSLLQEVGKGPHLEGPQMDQGDSQARGNQGTTPPTTRGAV